MCAVSFALVAAASILDRRVAEGVRDLQIKPSIMHSFAVDAIKTLGVYWTTVAIAVLVAWRHRLRWRAAIFMLMTGLIRCNRASMFNAIHDLMFHGLSMT